MYILQRDEKIKSKDRRANGVKMKEPKKEAKSDEKNAYKLYKNKCRFDEK